MKQLGPALVIAAAVCIGSASCGHDRAKQDAAMDMRLSEKDADVRHGQEAFLAGDYSSAIAAFKHSLDFPSDSLDAYAQEGLAMAYGRLGDNKRFLEHSLLAYDLDSLRNSAWNNLALAYAMNAGGKDDPSLEKAMSFATRYVADQPTEGKGFSTLGFIYFQMGDAGRAIQMLERSNGLLDVNDPDESICAGFNQYLIGRSLLNDGKRDSAEPHFVEAYRLGYRR